MVDDLTLQRYADGEMEPRERSELEALLAGDAGLRKRLEVYTGTRAVLRSAFDQVEALPVPHAWVRLIEERLAAQPEDRAVSRADAEPWSMRLLRQVLPDARGWRMAMAAGAAMLVAGLGAVLLPPASQDHWADFRTPAADRLFGSVLEQTVSGLGRTVEAGSGRQAQMRVSLSYRSKEGGYCRTFGLTDGSQKRAESLGCRQPAGDWRILALAPATDDTGSGPATTPAAGSAKSKVDEMVDHTIADDPLTLEEEARLIGSSWQEVSP